MAHLPLTYFAKISYSKVHLSISENNQPCIAIFDNFEYSRLNVSYEIRTMWKKSLILQSPC